jgi:hypothetical protein
MSLPGFQEFDDAALDLFYRVEPDGSALISGDRARCIIKEKLPDGSLIMGGINNNGMIFGDRIVRENGVERRYSLRWQDPTKPAPSGSRLAPKETRRSSLNDPMFDPPPGGRRSAPPAFQPSFPPPQATPPAQNILPETAELLRDMGASVKQQLTEAKEPPKSGSRMRRLLGRSSETEEPGASKDNLAMLSEVAEAIERTQAEVARVRADNVRAFEQVQRVEVENAQLRAELSRVREEAKEQLVRNNVEWKRKVQIRRWSVEEVHAHELVVEGLEAKGWEVEDPDGGIQYLVVATVPRGTQESIVKQWMDDLKARVDLMPFGGRAVYITKHEGTHLEVLELVPGVRTEGAEAATQF